MSPNYTITEAWLLDTVEETAADCYTVSLLEGLLRRESLGLPITPEHVRNIAQIERSAGDSAKADGNEPLQTMCYVAFSTLSDLADKLHEVK